MKFYRSSVFLILFLFLPGCFQKNNHQKQVIAWVNQEPIYLEDFQKQLNLNWGSDVFGIDDLDYQLRLKCLEEMISEHLILQEAKRLGIDLVPSEVEEEVRGAQEIDRAGFLHSLSQLGLSEEEWKQEIEKLLLIRKTVETVLKYQINLEEAELKRYYQEHIQDFILPERVRVRQILVSERKLAESIYRGLISGQDFDELAKKYSESPEAKTGGKLGWVERGQLPRAVEELVFKLKPGKVSRPLKTVFGYHILMVEDKTPPEKQSYEQVREQIYQKLLEEKQNHLYQKWISGLWRRSKIVINYQLL